MFYESTAVRAYVNGINREASWRRVSCTTAARLATHDVCFYRAAVVALVGVVAGRIESLFCSPGANRSAQRERKFADVTVSYTRGTPENLWA